MRKVGEKNNNKLLQVSKIGCRSDLVMLRAEIMWHGPEWSMPMSSTLVT